MKRALLLSILAFSAMPAFSAGIKTLAPNQSAQFTYTDTRLAAGNVQVILLHERGEKLTVDGKITVVNGVRTLQFTSPGSPGEWQVYAALMGSTSVHLGTIFEVKQ